MWKYVNILNAMIQILTTIGVGGIAGCVRVFEFDTFVAFMTQFVFSVSIPCLVIRVSTKAIRLLPDGIGIYAYIIFHLTRELESELTFTARNSFGNTSSPFSFFECLLSSLVLS